MTRMNAISTTETDIANLKGGYVPGIRSDSTDVKIPGAFVLPLAKVNPPTTSLFSLSNDGTSVATSVNGGSRFYTAVRTDTGASSAERVSFRGKAVPAGSSWDCTMGLMTPAIARQANSYYRIGLAILENSTGKSLQICYNTQNNGPSLQVKYYTNLNTYSADPATMANIVQGRFPIKFRISYDGTNYIFKVSYDDGDSWETMATLAKASYFTADRVGLMLETYNTFTTRECRAEVFYYSDPDF